MGNRLDLGTELLLNLIQVEPVFIGDEVDGETKVSESTGTTNTMKVSFRVLGEIKVDHHVDGLDIDTAREEVRADEVPTDAVAEVVEDAVTVRLEHLCVRVEARVAELGDLLREELDAVGGIAEDDGLVDLEL